MLESDAVESTQAWLPSGPVVKSPPANAGNMGLMSGHGGSHVLQSTQPRVPQLLSLCARAQELQLLKPTCPRAYAVQREKPTRRN